MDLYGKRKAVQQLRAEIAELGTPVYDRDDLPAGFTFEGPAIVEQFDSTVVVPPGTKAEVDQYLNIIIRV